MHYNGLYKMRSFSLCNLYSVRLMYGLLTTKIKLKDGINTRTNRRNK